MVANRSSLTGTEVLVGARPVAQAFYAHAAVMTVFRTNFCIADPHVSSRWRSDPDAAANVPPGAYREILHGSAMTSSHGSWTPDAQDDIATSASGMQDTLRRQGSRQLIARAEDLLPPSSRPRVARLNRSSDSLESRSLIADLTNPHIAFGHALDFSLISSCRSFLHVPSILKRYVD